MGESLGSRPEELYAEHKGTVERLDEMQKRLDAARVLSDILTPEQIGQLGSADFDAKMQYENSLKEATQHYQENQNAYVEQAKEEMQAKDIDTVKKILSDLKEWSRKDPGFVDPTPVNLDFVKGTDGLVESLKGLNSEQRNRIVSLGGLSSEQRNSVRRQLPDIKVIPEDEEQTQNPH